MYGREGETLDLAAAGDAIVTRRLSPCEAPGFRELGDRLRAADCGVVNLEVLLHDYESAAAGDSGGTYMRAPPAVLDDLDELGFSLLAAANNHTADYGEGGMLATMRALEERDWPYAGLGRTLALAREPAYVDTAAGRVALVAACSSITPGSVAGEQRPDMQGRPGLAPLRLETTYEVPESDLDRVRELADALGLEAERERRAGLGFPVAGEDREGYTFPGAGGDELHFVAGDDHRVRRTVEEDDRAAFRRRVEAAARQADWVVASVHAHEGVGPRSNEETVPAFLEELAHEAVDAGADAFVGHGPHVLRGVELYDGAPVCYSLGNFVMNNETVRRLPADIYDRYDLDTQRALPAALYDERVFEDGDPEGDRAGFLADRDFWESVAPVFRFRDGELARVDCYPVDLGYEAPRPQRGRPLLATGERATAILETLAERSEPYGTSVEIEDGVGVIRA